MVATIPTTKPGDIDHRSAELLHAHHEQVYRQTDRLFAGLLLAQWLVCIGLSLWYSPRTWLGATSTVHLHVWMAVVLGGIIAVPADHAQEVADQLTDAGIRGILNFAPVSISVGPHVGLATVDLAVQLEQLSFQVNFAEATKSGQRPDGRD